MRSAPPYYGSEPKVSVRRGLIAELVSVVQGGCGREAPVRTHVRGSPTMFALALAWATDSAEVVDVVAVCAAIQRQVNLKDAYPGMRLPDSPTNLRSLDAWPVVCAVSLPFTTSPCRAQLHQLRCLCKMFQAQTAIRTLTLKCKG